MIKNSILMNQKNAEIEQLINQMKALHNQQIDKLQSEWQNSNAYCNFAS